MTPVRTRPIARLLASGCVGALTVVSVSGCGSSASASSDLITQRQAKQVAQAYLHGSVVAGIGEERGSLRRIDDGIEALRTPGPQPTPDMMADDTIWMAHQQQYPISFLCFDKPLTPGQASPGQLFRFSKASASAEWTVTHQDVLESIASRPAVALDSDGFAQLVSPSDYGKFLVSPANVARDWGAYFAAGNAADGKEFAPGPLTTSVIESNKKQIDAEAALHHTLSLAYAPTGDAVDAYLLKDGGALVLVGLQVTSHDVANSGSIKVTQDGKGISAPPVGQYREVSNVALVLAAFAVPPKGSTVKLTVLGSYIGTVSAAGVKA